MRWLLTSIAILAFAPGCTGELIETDDIVVGNTVDAGSIGNVQGRADFDNNVRPLLILARPKTSCATCHEGMDLIDGPDFLGATAADNYAALVANTRLVGATPEASVLYTKGDHDGDAWCTGAGVPYATCTQDEEAILAAWIAVQASGL